MNIETGEIREFAENDDLVNFILGREEWVEIDPSKMTDKQKKTMHVSQHDQKSDLAVIRNIIRKQKRSARRKNKKESTDD